MSEGTRFLEDCPCCGEPGKLKSVKAYVGFMRGWVGCPACGLYIHWAHDPGGAIEKWNRRVKNAGADPEGGGAEDHL